ncbi:MAG: helix-hairpin-helix domain-containing protein [Phycisphaeraceae bacterium]|nr:MAG: helix-hairpin-helix domain-containing protein [Phycisphaeraceae bacterium]
MSQPRASRRATVLFAVLFLVVIAALSATTMLTSVAAERSAVTREAEEIQLRSALRSALLACQAAFDEQHEALLDGEAPDLPDEIRIDMGESDPAIVVKLVPLADGATVQAESARLDLNHATAEMLAALPSVSAALADRLVAARQNGLFLSPADALRVTGASALISMGDTSSEDSFGTGDAPDAALDVAAGESDTLELLTVYAAEPQVQQGLCGDDFRGLPRVNINAPWSDNIEKAFQQRLSDQAARTATELFIQGTKVAKPSELVKLLIERAVPQDEWPALLDALTTSPDLYRLGCVDINRASREVLAALPGMNDTRADDLITARERLDPAERASVAWPLEDGIVTPEQFTELVDHIATRSLQWRLMLRASFEPIDEFGSTGFGSTGFGPDDAGPGLLPQADEFGVEIDPGDQAADQQPGVTLEVVFDAAGVRARIAYLRDCTAYDFATRLASLGEFGDDALPDEAWAGDDLDSYEPMEPYDASDPDARPMTLDDLNASYFDDEPMDDEFADGFGDLSFFDDEPDDSAADGLPAGDSSRDDQPGGGPQAPPATGPPPASGDNRLGRWAPARKGGTT